MREFEICFVGCDNYYLCDRNKCRAGWINKWMKCRREPIKIHNCLPLHINFIFNKILRFVCRAMRSQHRIVGVYDNVFRSIRLFGMRCAMASRLETGRPLCGGKWWHSTPHSSSRWFLSTVSVDMPENSKISFPNKCTFTFIIPNDNECKCVSPRQSRIRNARARW